MQSKERKFFYWLRVPKKPLFPAEKLKSSARKGSEQCSKYTSYTLRNCTFRQCKSNRFINSLMLINVIGGNDIRKNVNHNCQYMTQICKCCKCNAAYQKRPYKDWWHYIVISRMFCCPANKSVVHSFMTVNLPINGLKLSFDSELHSSLPRLSVYQNPQHFQLFL